MGWIQARAACTLDNMFEKLMSAVNANVDEANDALADEYKVVVDDSGRYRAFGVVVAWRGKEYGVRRFSLQDDIVVEKSEGLDKPYIEMFRFRVKMTGNGDCKLAQVADDDRTLTAGALLTPNDVSRKVLEPLWVWLFSVAGRKGSL